MNAQQNHKTALVTGGGRGIGFGISECLVKEGYDLMFCGMKKKSDVKDVILNLSKYKTTVHYCQADISKTQDRKKLINEVKEKFGKLNVLVNNAGVAPLVRADVLEATEASFDRLTNINLKGPYFLTQLTANWMIEQKKSSKDYTGCVINISSISATAASPSRGDYCLTKAGISMATKLWAVCLAEYNIPVYEIRPGITKTDMTEAVTEKYDKLIAEGLLLQPRWGLPEDVGKAAAMLVRGDLPYSTGQVIMVDGGFCMEWL